MHPFVAYYIRNALPFVTGVVFVLAADHLGMSLLPRVALGAALVVAGPFVIQLVLTLLVEALHAAELGAGGGANRTVLDFPARVRR